MKHMKRVFVYLGMGSCVSTKSVEEPPSTTMEKTAVITTVQTPIWATAGSKDEQFFDSKAWLESDDEDFVSVNGDMSPVKQAKNNGDHQGRRLSDLFNDSSFSRDSLTSLRAAEAANGKDHKPATPKLAYGEKSRRSVKRCLPSLVRSLSCGDRNKKRLSPGHNIAVVG